MEMRKRFSLFCTGKLQKINDSDYVIKITGDFLSYYGIFHQLGKTLLLLFTVPTIVVGTTSCARGTPCLNSFF